MGAAIENLVDLFQRGGVVMWPLGALSLVSLMLIFERCWFWVATNRASERDKVHRVAELLRVGRGQEALKRMEGDAGVYAEVVRRVVAGGATEAVAIEAVESQRPRLNRFMAMLGTTITAAPMLGILGTVTGIISAFKILSASRVVNDPAQVSGGIAEALLTTVAGLVIALVVLLPYNAFRVQIERTMGRLEMLIAAAQQGAGIGRRPMGSDGAGGVA